MGETLETVRTVRDARFQYLRNFHPHFPFGRYANYVWQHESMRAWASLYQAGKLTGPPARFFAPTKPVEELYDVARDPWQIDNMAADPSYADELRRLRAVLAEEMLVAGDLGLLPEREMHDSALRWWGATGLLALRDAAAPAKSALLAALDDSSPDVRIAAAESVAHFGLLDRALPVLETALRVDDVFVRLAALNAAHRLGSRARPLLPAIRQAKLTAPAHKDASIYLGTMVDYLPGRIEE